VHLTDRGELVYLERIEDMRQLAGGHRYPPQFNRCLWLSHAGAAPRQQKNSARLKAPPLPEGFLPRGVGANTAAHPLVDRHHALSPGPGHRPTSFAMPMLRETLRASG